MSDVPVLIRRTTMLVNDIEPSLQIYRDILGMSVHYDEKSWSPEMACRPVSPIRSLAW